MLAIAVALNIVWEGSKLVRRSVHGLMDVAVDGQEQAAIDAVLTRFTLHQGGQPLVRFDHVMTRKSGQRRFVGLHMHLPPGWTLGRADDLRQQVERALADAVPALHASIQLLPDGVEPLTVDLSEPPEGGAHESHAH